MAGASTKFTRDTVERLLEAVRAGLPYHLAAEAAGISESTFYDWQRGKFPRGLDEDQKALKSEFLEGLTRAKGDSALTLMQIIKDAAPEDWRAAAWILERRFPRDFGKQLVELTGENGGPVAIEVQAIQKVILKALQAHPDARLEVAQALKDAGKDRRERIA